MNTFNNLYKKALKSVFFCALSIYINSTAYAQAPNNCSTLHFDDTAKLKYVHDGDTIRLTDNRKIRLLGIDTPELARKGKPTQPFALDAKRALKTLLASNNNVVNLVYGNERKDHYGRTLAHLFLDNGKNVQASLISQGLAIAFTTPPNIGFSECYKSSESTARTTKRGIWTQRPYKPIQATDYKGDTEGFHIIESLVQKVHINKKSIWINLENNINVQIRKKDRHYFNLETLNCMVGKPIRIRGWLHRKDKGAYMSLRHPASLALIDKKSCN